MKKIRLCLVLLVAGSVIQGQPPRGFQFVESSAGMNYPSWESGMTELEFADINMDGYVDILSIGDHGCPNINAQEHGIMVWFGDGTGTWSVQMTGNFGYGGIAVGDVNNDGLWDVGYGMHHNYSSTDLGDQLLEVALGDGTGINWTPWDNGLATNGENWGMFGTDFADVDNDGDLDVGSNSFGSGSGIHVYINQGDGTWVQSFGILPGNSNMRFEFGDINNDGNVDFVVTHDAGIAFFGDGAGNFTNADYNLPNYSFPMGGPDLSDITGDGGQDLAYVNPDGGIDVWTFDPGTSLWTDLSGSLPATGNYQEAQLCDFNGDGMPDMAAYGNAQLTVWKGTPGPNQSVTWTQEFTTTTSNNGDCAAFRTGGDVDRNGFPDMTFVEKVGSWISGKNQLKCYKEATPYQATSIRVIYPYGNEKFRHGSVQFTDWISAVPDTSTATVRIDYSLTGMQGPWTMLSSGASNSGRFQWIIPTTVSTNNCYLKFTLAEGEDTLTAMNPVAFTILGDDDVVADFMAGATQTYPGTDVQFTDLSLGLITSWAWDFDNDGTVDATERNPTHAYSQVGIYTVKLTVSDGNTSDTGIKTDYITVIPHVAVDNKDNPGECIVYPNPVSEKLYISYTFPDNEQVRVTLFTVSGRMIEEVSVQGLGNGSHVKMVDMGAMPPGVYIYRIESKSSCITGRIIRI
jgi:PKD repeat protein